MRNVYAAVLMVFGLVAVLPVQAQEEELNVGTKSVHQHQFLSKRPYQAPVVAAKSGAEQGWEGASMVTGQEQKEKHLQLLKMHSIGKRPL
jgi:hypothetical protein